MSTNKTIVIFIALLALGLGLGAADQPVKIGTVDVERALFATVEGKAAREQLESQGREVEAELRPKAERYQEMVEELQKKRVVLSDEKRREMEFDIQELGERIQTRENEAQRRFRLDQERLFAPLQQRVLEAVREVGREAGFSLILVRGQPPILYSREALDVTDLIIAQVEKAGE